MAKRNFKHWTPAEDAVLRERWHLERPEDLAALLERTVVACKARAWSLLLSAKNPCNAYTSTQVALALGVSSAHVARLVRQGAIRTIGNRTQKFVTREELERVMPSLSRKTQVSGWVTAAQAQRLLGYSRASINKLCANKALRAYKANRYWRIDASHVAELASKMRAAGTTRLDWRSLSPEMQAYSLLQAYNRNLRKIGIRPRRKKAARKSARKERTRA
jgi:hypothetical protein